MGPADTNGLQSWLGPARTARGMPHLLLPPLQASPSSHLGRGLPRGHFRFPFHRGQAARVYGLKRIQTSSIGLPSRGGLPVFNSGWRCQVGSHASGFLCKQAPQPCLPVFHLDTFPSLSGSHFLLQVLLCKDGYWEKEAQSLGLHEQLQAAGSLHLCLWRTEGKGNVFACSCPCLCLNICRVQSTL